MVQILEMSPKAIKLGKNLNNHALSSLECLFYT